jgi:antitoxin VapB
MPISSAATRHVRLFKNGTSQAVRIPREFELPGNEAVLRRDEQGRLILESIPRRNLLGIVASWKPLSKKDQLPEIDDLPADPVEL